MEVFVRFTLFVTILTGTFIGIGYTQPAWLADLGLDFWNLPDMQKALAESSQLSEELDQIRAYRAESTRIKDDVVKRVINSELTLAAGADAILAQCDHQSLEQGFESLEIEGRSEKECVCKLLVIWAERQLESHPEKLATVRGQLTEQLTQILIESENELTQE